MHTLRWASQGRHITASTYSRELGARTVPSILPWSLTRIFTHPGHSSAIKSADKDRLEKRKFYSLRSRTSSSRIPLVLASTEGATQAAPRRHDKTQC